VKDNSEDMVAKGRSCYGERRPDAKLTESDVREIRGLLSTGKSQHAIAAMFGINQATVSLIARRKIWKHLE